MTALRRQRQPFFVIGTGRCGSTLLCHLLQAHPSVAMTNEGRLLDALWFFFQFARLPAFREQEFTFSYQFKLHGLVGSNYCDDFAAVLGEHAQPLLEQFYERHFAGREFTHYGDKLPGIEAAHAFGTLAPRTKFVLLSRDPRDVLCSIRAHARSPRALANNPLLEQPRIPDFANHWRNLHAGALDYLPDRLHVRYEDLLLDRTTVLARVMEYLGLDVVPEQTSILGREELFASHGTKESPEQTVGRWRADLSAADRAQVEAICAPVMARLGYEA